LITQFSNKSIQDACIHGFLSTETVEHVHNKLRHSLTRSNYIKVKLDHDFQQQTVNLDNSARKNAVYSLDLWAMSLKMWLYHLDLIMRTE